MVWFHIVSADAIGGNRHLDVESWVGKQNPPATFCNVSRPPVSRSISGVNKTSDIYDRPPGARSRVERILFHLLGQTHAHTVFFPFSFPLVAHSAAPLAPTAVGVGLSGGVIAAADPVALLACPLSLPLRIVLRLGSSLGLVRLCPFVLPGSVLSLPSTFSAFRLAVPARSEELALRGQRSPSSFLDAIFACIFIGV